MDASRSATGREVVAAQPPTNNSTVLYKAMTGRTLIDLSPGGARNECTRGVFATNVAAEIGALSSQDGRCTTAREMGQFNSRRSGWSEESRRCETGMRARLDRRRHLSNVE